jgi:hypothetical protein
MDVKFFIVLAPGGFQNSLQMVGSLLSNKSLGSLTLGAWKANDISLNVIRGNLYRLNAIRGRVI